MNETIKDFSTCHTHDDLERFTANYNKLMADLQTRKMEFKNPKDVDRFDNDIIGRQLYMEWYKSDNSSFIKKTKDVEFISELIRLFIDFYDGKYSRKTPTDESTFNYPDEYLTEIEELKLGCYESDDSEYMKCDYQVIKQSKRSSWLNRQYINKTKFGFVIVCIQLLFRYLYMRLLIFPLLFLREKLVDLNIYLDEIKKSKKSLDK